MSKEALLFCLPDKESSMNTLAFFVGLAAVVIFLLSYLQKERKDLCPKW